MPGGQKEAYELVEPILTAISAKVEGDAWCTYIGPNGAGHYVKMVHNGIEYGDMQLICEAYFIMKHVLGLNAQELHEVFAEWNKGELDSYLIEITADIFTKVDEETGKTACRCHFRYCWSKRDWEVDKSKCVKSRCFASNYYGICICSVYICHEGRASKGK
jgi:6-phosphogluconate dehydrogenase (decarboxylating)